MYVRHSSEKWVPCFCDLDAQLLSERLDDDAREVGEGFSEAAGTACVGANRTQDVGREENDGQQEGTESAGQHAALPTLSVTGN